MKAPPFAQATEERVADKRPSLLGPMRFRDFRLLWSGLLISNLGTWMQFTALGYEVVRIAPTVQAAALNVGLIGAARAVPVFALSPFAGVVADRFPRRRVLLMTNSVTAALAAALAIIIATGHSSIGLLMLLSGAAAGTQSFDAPARQSWVPLMVPREFVSTAIGLNSLAFNMPAAIGPPIAGIVIATFGVAPCMAANALFTLAVVVALLFMKSVAPSSTQRETVWKSIIDGVRFLFEHPVLRWVLLLLVLTSLAVRPYSFLLPAYAAHIIHTDARGLGWMMAATGLGSIGGALATAAFQPKRRSALWAGSALLVAFGTVGLGLTDNMAVVLVLLTAMGLGTLAFMGSSNILLQTLTPDDMRGRAISVYAMVVLGFAPAGSLLLGSIATIVGLQWSLAGGGALGLACTIWVYAAHPELRAI